MRNQNNRTTAKKRLGHALKPLKHSITNSRAAGGLGRYKRWRQGAKERVGGGGGEGLGRQEEARWKGRGIGTLLLHTDKNVEQRNAVNKLKTSKSNESCCVSDSGSCGHSWQFPAGKPRSERKRFNGGL